MREARKRRKKIGDVLCALVGALFLMAFGGFFFWLAWSSMRTAETVGGALAFGALLMLFLPVGLFLQILAHELGHLFFGRVSGYEFVSFQILGLTLSRDAGRLRLARYKVIGAAGQCLLMPRLEHELKCPYILYNLGGVILNVLLSGACILLYRAAGMGPGGALFLMASAVGLFFALTKGLPLPFRGVSNDGMNVRMIRKSPEARHAFWVQLRVYGELASGRRLRDMPRGWFSLSAGADMRNSILAHIGVMRCAFLHDRGVYDAAEILASYLVCNVDSLPETVKNDLRCELLFYELIGRQRDAEIQRLYTPRLEKHIRATSAHIARRRLMYAYALLYRCDPAAAAAELAAFNRAAARHPYSAEVAAERESLAHIEDLAAELRPN